jgi:hypothetical protein
MRICHRWQSMYRGVHLLACLNICLFKDVPCTLLVEYSRPNGTVRNREDIFQFNDSGTKKEKERIFDPEKKT